MLTYLTGTLSGVITILLLLLRRKKYAVSYKVLVALLLGAGIFGFLGTKIASFWEHGSWGGMRFYGKVIFVCIVLWVISIITKIPFKRISSYYVPSDIASLALMKVNCFFNECCQGKTLNWGNITIKFPSQIAEFITAIVILLVLLVLENKFDKKEYVFPVYLMSYGATRFFYEYMRVYQSRKINIVFFELSVAHICCICILMLGVILMVCYISKSNSETKRIK